jgi:hypothetical protein
MKAVFLTNPDDFDSQNSGGVQICSREYFEVLAGCFDSMCRFDVRGSRHIADRIHRKIGVKRYLNHNPLRKKVELAQLTAINPDVILINHCELLRYAKTLKNMLPSAKIILLSHGNRSGDDLFELSSDSGRFRSHGKTRWIDVFRFGSDVIMESVYRRKFIDAVVAMSKEEVALEQWLGAQRTFYFPRIIESNVLPWEPVPLRIGFMGTLDHTPNRVAIEQICEWFEKNVASPPEIRLIGYCEDIGQSLDDRFLFVTYLGALNDSEVLAEVQTWCLFLNPIFWLSRGASMKLKTVLAWGIPTLTTNFGMRGYDLPHDAILTTDSNVESFCQAIEDFLRKPEAATKVRRHLESGIFPRASVECVREEFCGFLRGVMR